MATGQAVGTWRTLRRRQLPAVHPTRIPHASTAHTPQGPVLQPTISWTCFNKQVETPNELPRSPVSGPGVGHGVAVVAVRVHLQHDGACVSWTSSTANELQCNEVPKQHGSAKDGRTGAQQGRETGVVSARWGGPPKPLGNQLIQPLLLCCMLRCSIQLTVGHCILLGVLADPTRIQPHQTLLNRLLTRLTVGHCILLCVCKCLPHRQHIHAVALRRGV